MSGGIDQFINGPGFKSLPWEARQAFEIARYLVMTPGASIGDAARLAGLNVAAWNAQRLYNGIMLMSDSMIKMGARHAAAEAIMAEGSEIALAAGAEAGGAGMADSLFARLLPWLGLLVVLGGVTYGVATYVGSRSGDDPVQPGHKITQRDENGAAAGATPCPSPLPLSARKCPWTPEGAEVKECPPGYCWDGGFRGSGSCQQEESVPNSWRNYGNALYCNEGYKDVRDPCTNNILRCEPQ